MKFIITYDLNGDDKNYQELYTKLEGLNAKHLAKSTWLLDLKPISVSGVFDYFEKSVDSNDTLIVDEIAVRNNQDQLVGQNTIDRI